MTFRLRFRAMASALALVVALPAAADAPPAECRARYRLEAILNGGVRVAPSFEVDRGPAAPVVMRMYDIIDHWAVAVALGDYEGARTFADRVLRHLAVLLAEIDARPSDDPDTAYARLSVSATAARVALVAGEWLEALHHGRIARESAAWLEARRPGDTRVRFFRGLLEYYAGVAPMWVRGLGAFSGVDGDPERGLALLEETVRSNNALAPEAARVLLEEVRRKHRPECRYLPLAGDLAASFPRNFRFQWYVERERERCESWRDFEDDDVPRLAFAFDCMQAALDPP